MVDECFDIDTCIIRDDATLPPIRIQEHIDNISDARELTLEITNHHRYTNKITNECYELSPGEEFKVAMALYTSSTKSTARLKKIVTFKCIISSTLLLLASCIWGIVCAVIFEFRTSLMFALTGSLILGYFGIPPIMKTLNAILADKGNRR